MVSEKTKETHQLKWLVYTKSNCCFVLSLFGNPSLPSDQMFMLESFMLLHRLVLWKVSEHRTEPNISSLISTSSKQVFQKHTPLFYYDNVRDANIYMFAELITCSKNLGDCCPSKVSHILKYFENKPERDSFIFNLFFFLLVWNLL